MRGSWIAFLSLAMAPFAARAVDTFPEAFGPQYGPAQPLAASPRHGPRNGIGTVRRWNEIAINASGLDHTPVAPGEQCIYGEQLGPCRAARAMAIVHIAMFDTVNAAVGDDQSYTGIFWAYDGTPSLCAPPRLYNQLAVHLADHMGISELDPARLLALVKVAMADAGLAIWESKYYYDFWRPVLGILWRFDKDQAIALGRRVGDYALDHVFTPLHRHGQ